MKYLITGLGNIGDEYANTRHNIGFDVVFAFAKKHNGVFETDRHVYKADVKWKGRQFICICPTTYMNLSGKAVKYWLDKEGIKIENSLTILDDIALGLDKLRLRPGGSDAGHNGLKSINASIGTIEYPRLRFGVGNDFPKGMQVEYVLGKWKRQEEPLVQKKIEASVEVIENFGTIGLVMAMNQVNNKTYSL